MRAFISEREKKYLTERILKEGGVGAYCITLYFGKDEAEWEGLGVDLPIQELQTLKQKLYTDGGCICANEDGNVDDVYYGSWKLGRRSSQYIQFHDCRDVNEAEYRALVDGLRFAVSFGKSVAEVFIDSDNMYRQLIEDAHCQRHLIKLRNTARVLLVTLRAELKLLRRTEIKAVLGH